MTGLDTNVLLDWLLEGQARPLEGKPPYRVSMIVLAELAWVLGSTMKRARAETVEVLHLLLSARELVIASRDTVVAALADYAVGPAEFADYLILHDNAAGGCAATLTLDRKAARHPGFRLVG